MDYNVFVPESTTFGYDKAEPTASFCDSVTEYLRNLFAMNKASKIFSKERNSRMDHDGIYTLTSEADTENSTMGNLFDDATIKSYTETIADYLELVTAYEDEYENSDAKMRGSLREVVNELTNRTFSSKLNQAENEDIMNQAVNIMNSPPSNHSEFVFKLAVYGYAFHKLLETYEEQFDSINIEIEDDASTELPEDDSSDPNSSLENVSSDRKARNGNAVRKREKRNGRKKNLLLSDLLHINDPVRMPWIRLIINNLLSERQRLFKNKNLKGKEATKNRRTNTKHNRSESINSEHADDPHVEDGLIFSKNIISKTLSKRYPVNNKNNGLGANRIFSDLLSVRDAVGMPWMRIIVDDIKGDRGNVLGNITNKQMRNMLLREHIMYEGIPLDSRPSIPKVPYSKRTLFAVNTVNEILAEHMSMGITLEEICHWIYVGARTVSMELVVSSYSNMSVNNEMHYLKKNMNETNSSKNWSKKKCMKLATDVSIKDVISNVSRNRSVWSLLGRRWFLNPQNFTKKPKIQSLAISSTEIYDGMSDQGGGFRKPNHTKVPTMTKNLPIKSTRPYSTSVTVTKEESRKPYKGG
ncbi:unnamed protein product [Nezara viridula]|uniref:Uncharacterized protein n=1 Tax=Nezara viridula TaxID=85310 RepID=A0A9P0GZZ6_NEZVI|nr:unnamed protein product [Nezara viridula]